MNFTEKYYEDAHWVKLADSIVDWCSCFNPDDISVCSKLDTS